jgi:hypothetical protein
VAAVALAYCQPAVGAFFNFELWDEHRLGGWQSGVLYANGVRKASFAAFEQVAALSSAGAIDCSTVNGAPAQPSDPLSGGLARLALKVAAAPAAVRTAL